MGFVPFNNVVKLELFIRQDLQEVENVLHWQMPATPTISTLDALASDVQDWWDTGIKPITPTNARLIAIKATSLNSQTAPSVEYVTGMPIVGTSAQDAMPNNVTIAIRFLTALRGRSFRGRLFHIGVTRNNVDDNEILQAYADALEAVYGALLIPAAFGSAELVVASRVSGGVERTLGVATTITGVTVNRTLDSQRRRLPGRGR